MEYFRGAENHLYFLTIECLWIAFQRFSERENARKTCIYVRIRKTTKMANSSPYVYVYVPKNIYPFAYFPSIFKPFFYSVLQLYILISSSKCNTYVYVVWVRMLIYVICIFPIEYVCILSDINA